MIKFFSILLIFFSGCAIKEIKISHPYIVTIKLNNFRFNDYAIIEKYRKKIVIKAFNAGILINRISIDSKICTKEGCMSKKEFNRRFLTSSYPEDIFKNIISGEKIFNSEGYIKKNSGFEQKIYKKNSLDIIYKVDKDSIYFKDRINKILIKIRKVNG